MNDQKAYKNEIDRLNLRVSELLADNHNLQSDRKNLDYTETKELLGRTSDNVLVWLLSDIVQLCVSRPGLHNRDIQLCTQAAFDNATTEAKGTDDE